jgi:hypothetical protein
MALDALDIIEVPTPCQASWDAMHGNHRVRFCQLCRLNVYNLSEMKRREALKLVEEREGRICVRFFRRPDGTVVTRDGCRGVIRAARRRLARMAASLAAVVAFFVAGGLFARSGAPHGLPTRRGPLMRLASWLEPASPPVISPTMPPVAGGLPVPRTVVTGETNAPYNFKEAIMGGAPPRR